MDNFVLDTDESRSLLAVGGRGPALHNLPEIVAALERNDSDEQAFGWPMLLAQWGRFVGWSEYALRSLPLLAGMLALAAVHRAGRAWFGPRVALTAILLLGTSLLFTLYMHIARTFTLVTLFATLALASYWRVAVRRGPAGRGAQAGLLLAGAGMLYTHYFCALLLPALGLFHLFFARRGRRWWRALLLLAIPPLLALPQLPLMLSGYHDVLDSTSLHRRAMHSPAALAWLLEVLGNGSLILSPFLATALVVLALLLLLRAARGSPRVTPAGFLASIVLLTLLLMLIANELLGTVIVGNRVRYFMSLWPALALLAARGLGQLRRRNRELAALLLAGWLLFGLESRFDRGQLTGILNILRPYPLHYAFPVLADANPEADLLAMEKDIQTIWNKNYYGLQAEPAKLREVSWEPRESTDELDPLFAQARRRMRVWLLVSDLDDPLLRLLRNGLQQEGMNFCIQYLNHSNFLLELYARIPAYCPNSPVRLAFEADIEMTASDLHLEDGFLKFHAGLRSADQWLPERYSLAIHLIEPASGQRVAQSDVGVGPGRFILLRGEIDIRGLRPGEYELHIGLYNWRTGARLPGRDRQSGAQGDFFMLQGLRIG